MLMVLLTSIPWLPTIIWFLGACLVCFIGWKVISLLPPPMSEFAWLGYIIVLIIAGCMIWQALQKLG